MNQPTYAGVGSRETPLDAQNDMYDMYDIAWVLAEEGWWMRSGGAKGADQAFYDGCMEWADETEDRPQMTIYLPWEGMNNLGLGVDREGGYGSHKISPVDQLPLLEETAKQFHPAWGNLRHGGRKLMARNVAVMLDWDQEHTVDAVICWTKGGKIAGGTGQALRIAKERGVPVFNLFNMSKNNVLDAMREISK